MAKQTTQVKQVLKPVVEVKDEPEAQIQESQINETPTQNETPQKGNTVVKFKRLSPEVQLPHYATEGSACMDLRAFLYATTYEGKTESNSTVYVKVGVEKLQGENFGKKYIHLDSNTRVLLTTGLFVEIPEGYVLKIKGRSGLSHNFHVVLTNSEGVIDSDYRGELLVALVNNSGRSKKIYQFDKIAQIELQKVEYFEFEEVETLSETSRGAGGFGSTGSQ